MSWPGESLFLLDLGEIWLKKPIYLGRTTPDDRATLQFFPVLCNVWPNHVVIRSVTDIKSHMRPFKN